MTEGFSLNSASHPIAPWWRRLWLWIFHRDINADSLETFEIDLPDNVELVSFGEAYAILQNGTIVRASGTAELPDGTTRPITDVERKYFEDQDKQLRSAFNQFRDAARKPQ